MRACLPPLILALLTSTALAQPEAEPLVAEPAPSIGYEKGFFVKSADEKFSLFIQGRVQGRFEFSSVDDEVAGRDEESAFTLERVRLTLKGNAFEKNLKYKFQPDFGKGGVVLKDFTVDYRLGEGPWVRVGQWKRPFSRQHIGSSGRLEFVDRAITHSTFGGARDIGVAVHNNYTKSPEIEWVVGLFNGGASPDKPALSGDVMTDPMTGEGEITGGSFSNVPSKVGPAMVARVGYNHNGIKGYREADLEGGPLRFGVGASVLSEFDLDDDDASFVRGGIDYIAKVEGLSTTGGVYVSSAQDGTGFADQSFAAVGFHLQLGYMLGSKYQPAVRYGLVALDGADNNMQEITGAFSVYQIAHNFKWQSDAGVLIEQSGSGSLTNFIARTQLQLSW